MVEGMATRRGAIVQYKAVGSYTRPSASQLAAEALLTLYPLVGDKRGRDSSALGLGEGRRTVVRSSSVITG